MIMSIILVIIAVSLSSSSIESAPVEDDPYYGCRAITKDLRRVCGSDGKVYDNISALKCAAVKNKDLKVVEDGKCAEIAVSLSSSSIESASVEDNPFEGCGPITKDQNQVCGSDGNLYDNISQLRCAALKNKDLKEVECSEPAKIDSATTSEENSDEKP
ncbi:hypothetical protein QAD02_018289 [Eretmocerus hayati]|uniref:Uncharacterized protein n=1 Tax=Eretmocerus hayati TaxID=131215 RepID=A0ACC2PJC5_9HYME|nr:hypothetical protein QAD02_018289 [Eretmocerus hayati]